MIEYLQYGRICIQKTSTSSTINHTAFPCFPRHHFSRLCRCHDRPPPRGSKASGRVSCRLKFEPNVGIKINEQHVNFIVLPNNIQKKWFKSLRRHICIYLLHHDSFVCVYIFVSLIFFGMEFHPNSCKKP